MGTSCPGGYEFVGSTCYSDCPDGYARSTSNPGACVPIEGRLKPATYSRGIGYYQETDCRDATNSTCEKEGDKWYPVCMSGYGPVDRETCVSQCKSGGYKLVCDDNKVSTQTESQISVSTIIVVVVLIAMLIAIAYGMFSSTRPDVVGTIVGEPNDDTYHALEKLTYGRRKDDLIYV